VIKSQPRKLFLLPLLALLAIALSACGSNYHRVQAAPGVQAVSYDDNLRDDALCIDNNYVRVPDDRCSPLGDDGWFGGYGWVHHPYPVTADYLDVVYVGYPVDRGLYALARPSNVRTYYIDRGRFPAYPPPGVRAVSVRVPTVAYVNKTKSNPAFAGKPPAFAPIVVPANKPLPTAAKVGPPPNPNVFRGGLGVKGSGSSGPAPNRSLNSPAPGRTTTTAPAAPKTTSSGSSSSGNRGSTSSSKSGR
jgi:hypothetical protein